MSIKKSVVAATSMLVFMSIQVLAGSISGTVTGPSSQGLQSIDVTAYSWYDGWWNWTSYASTDSSGNYTISGLDTGTYRVEFRDYSDTYAGQTYQNYNGGVQSGGTDIAVVSGSAVTGINGQLMVGARITGRLINSASSPVQGIQASAFVWNGDNWDQIAADNTDADGNYDIGGLFPGTYRVQFKDYNGGTYVPSVYGYPSATDVSQGGTDLAVTLGAIIENINATLFVGATITGTVTDESGNPLANIKARHWVMSGPSEWSNSYSAYTDQNGQYELSGLPAGSCRVSFYDDQGNYSEQIYNGKFGWIGDVGDDITLVAEQTTSGINAQMTTGGGISGTVTGPDGVTALSGIYVSAYIWNGSSWSYAEQTQAGEDGTYSLSGLPPGAYRLRFNDYDTYEYLSQVYSGIHDEWDVSVGGTDITVWSGNTRTNIDVSMIRGGTITGTVSGPDGVTPLEGIEVSARMWNGSYWYWGGWAETDENGDYSITGLSAGIYRLVFRDWSAGIYVDQVYSGFYMMSDPSLGGNNVNVASINSTVTGINVSMQEGATITGRVTQADGVTPISGAYVKVKNLTHDRSFGTFTDENGYYTRSGIYSGVCIIKAEADGYAAQWGGGANHEAFATTLTLNLGDQVEQNFAMSAGQSPAYVQVTSSPSGAEVYLNHQPTGLMTPVLVDLGEVGDFDADNNELARPVISVKKAGYAIPRSVILYAAQGETIEEYFELSQASGTLSVSTTPEGAEVYVDYADISTGVTPLNVGNLAPGSHTLLLKKDGYLRPRPVRFWINEAGDTCDVEMPLQSDSASERIMADVSSDPSGASIYVNYLPTGEVTPAVVDTMCPASHSGQGWASTRHTVMIAPEGARPVAPRYLPETINTSTVVQISYSLNLISPSNGGVLESFTSQYDANVWSALNLTDGGVADGQRWVNGGGVNPGPQTFEYSFADGQSAVLTGFTLVNATRGFNSKDFEISILPPGEGAEWENIFTGTLFDNDLLQYFNLNNVSAESVRLVITSGYSSDYWELGEFELYGNFADLPPRCTITRSGSSPTNADTLGFDIGFNEAVTGFTQSDITLYTTGDANGTLGSFSGSGSSYSVQVLNVTGDGTIGISVPAGVCMDSTDQANEASGQVLYSVDNTAPVAGVASAPSSQEGGSITVSYSGSSDAGGSGLKHVELWVRKDSGSWQDSGLSSTATSGSFLYAPPSSGTYYFALVAEDNAGNRSAAASGNGDTQTVYTLPPQSQNLVAQSNGGVLESFTSEYFAGTWSALNLTDGGVADGQRWVNGGGVNPGPQTFEYSFADGNTAMLTGFTLINAPRIYNSKDFELWASADGTNWDKIYEGTLANNTTPQSFVLQGEAAQRARLVIKSGYSTDYWELAEFELNGYFVEVTQAPVFSPMGGAYTGISSISVTVSSATEGAVIRYTTDGSEPTESSAIVASGGTVTVPVPGTLRARAWKDGVMASSIRTALYTPQVQNLVLPSNGGMLESFSSQFDGVTWSALNLTDGGVADGQRWVNGGVNPGPQTFEYSFADGKTAMLTGFTLYNGQRQFNSKDFALQISTDGENWSEVYGGTLANHTTSQSFDLEGLAAQRVRLIITSGYSTDYWELGEFELRGYFRPQVVQIPDQWLIDHYGSTAGAPDTSVRGWPLVWEYIAGTDPTDPQSRFALGQIGTVGNNISMQTQSVTGRVYWIEYSDSLVGGQWQRLGDEVPGTGSALPFEFPISGNGRYYRVRVRMAE